MKTASSKPFHEMADELKTQKEEPFTDAQNFDDALLKAVDEGLMTLGETAKKIVYFHIQNKYFLKIEDIPKNPELFVLALKSLLGMGASFIETLILKKLCAKFGLEVESLKSNQFLEAINEIREKFDSTNSIL